MTSADHMTAREQLPPADAPMSAPPPREGATSPAFRYIRVDLYPCGNPACGHPDVLHHLKDDGKRGHCTHHAGARCIPCPCTAFVTEHLNEETPR